MDANDSNSLIFNNADTKLKHDQDMLSAEDLAWADSCLIVDPDISETNMDSIKEALLHILDHFEINGASASEQGNSTDKTDPESSHLVVEEEVTSHAADKSIDQDLEQESYDAVSILKKQPFLPNFHDEMMNMQYSDDVDDAGFLVSEFVTEPLPDDDIFKVWDLDIPVEDDELNKQLKEALSSDPKTKGLKLESVDSLVESIAGLSIK